MSEERENEITEEEKEKVEEKGLEREYRPPETIEVKPKEELEEVAEPLIDIYMKERGVSDRKQALIKLLNVMSRIGYKPPNEIANMKQYVNTVRGIIDSVPDYPETIPLKAALAGESALHASKMLKEQFSGDPEMKEIIKHATRMAITMRVLDRVLTPENQNQNPINERIAKTLEDITKRIEKLEGERERRYLEELVEKRIQPVREALNEIKEIVKKVSVEKGKETPSEVSKIVDKLDELKDKLTEKERDELIRDLKETINKLPEKIGEYTSKGELGLDVIDKVLDVSEKIERRLGKREGETDWRSTAITTIGDVIKDVVPKIVEAGREEGEEEEGELKSLIDQKVLEYVANVKIYGDGKLNIKRCAEHLGITVEQVKDSLERLARKGLISVYKPVEKKEEKKEGKEKEKEEKEEAGEEEELLSPELTESEKKSRKKKK